MTYRRNLGAVLPSSDSVQRAIRGEPGAFGKVLVSTGLRALLILPGMAIVGVRGSRLVAGSLLSSATITAALFLFYRRSMVAEAVPTVGQDPVLAETTADVAAQIASTINTADQAAPGMEGLRAFRRRR